MQEFAYATAATYQKEGLFAKRDAYPQFETVEELCKGANNCALLVEDADGNPFLLRQPRRRSDTQQREAAEWEFRYTCIAAEMGVAPPLYDAWYHRHARRGKASGLHMVCAHYDHDLDTLVKEAPDLVLAHRHAIREKIVSHVRSLADAGMLCFDIKPGNIVLSISEMGEVDLRFIDFGRDFCEWNPGMQAEELAPVTTRLQKRVRELTSDAAEAGRLYRTALFRCMLVLVGCTLHCRLESLTRLSFFQRAELNVVGPVNAEERCRAREADLLLLRLLLRHPEVRSTLAHYMGRSYSGTRRVERLSNFVPSLARAARQGEAEEEETEDEEMDEYESE